MTAPQLILPTTTQAASLLRFRELRLQAEALLREASWLPGIPDQFRAQAVAASKLAGMKLHRSYGAADAADALSYRDDLEDIAKAIDPLVLAIGDEAKSDFPEIELTDFEDQLFNALDGNALYALTEAAERFDEARREDAA